MRFGLKTTRKALGISLLREAAARGTEYLIKPCEIELFMSPIPDEIATRAGTKTRSAAEILPAPACGRVPNNPSPLEIKLF